MTFASRILGFYADLKLPVLPEDVFGMMPWHEKRARKLMVAFYEKFYNDERPRTLLMGINPGRHGSGITGIPFTDPVVLEQDCGISNPFTKKRELSSEFIFMLIAALGGPDVFYRNFYISAMSPVGFLKEGKNMNYYDRPDLLSSLDGFMEECLIVQREFPLNTQVTFSIGKGKNWSYLKQVNERLGLFQSVDVLPHPRWIMQYRRKQLQLHLDQWVELLQPFIHSSH